MITSKLISEFNLSLLCRQIFSPFSKRGFVYINGQRKSFVSFPKNEKKRQFYLQNNTPNEIKIKSNEVHRQSHSVYIG